MKPESPQEEKKPIGRPSDYSDALAETICERLIMGESMATICADAAMPSETTVYRWLPLHEYFRERLAGARVGQAHRMMEQVLDIADDGSNDFMTITKGDASYEIENKEWTSRSKLRVEARLKLMALLAPKVYGPKIAVDHTNAGEPFKAYAGFDPAQV